jgi:hypothetical protein
MAQHTVKARLRHGTRSLDLTIPVGMVKEKSINEGDVFLVEISENSKNQTVITYSRIFKQEMILHKKK